MLQVHVSLQIILYLSYLKHSINNEDESSSQDE